MTEGNGISPRQKEVLELLMEGLSEKQVALRLGISVHTAHGYVKVLYKRLDVCSRGELYALVVNEMQRRIKSLERRVPRLPERSRAANLSGIEFRSSTARGDSRLRRLPRLP